MYYQSSHHNTASNNNTHIVDNIPPINNISSPAVLQVSVTGMGASYRLTASDLNKVFSRFGEIRHVDVSTEGTVGYVSFHSENDAINCSMALNDKVLSGVPGRLSVLYIKDSITSPTTTASSEECVEQNTVLVPKKYTCRFDIGIVNDSGFSVCRKIIGHRGANMKNIVSRTKCKLRLRGKGSGFVEGLTESSDELHLCLSSTEKPSYDQAVAMVKVLLTQVYREYREYVRLVGDPIPGSVDPDKLDIKMTEKPLYKNMSNSPQMNRK